MIHNCAYHLQKSMCAQYQLLSSKLSHGLHAAAVNCPSLDPSA